MSATWWRDFITGNPVRYVKTLFIVAPLRNLEGCSYNGDIERGMKEGSRKGVSLSEGAL